VRTKGGKTIERLQKDFVSGSLRPAIFSCFGERFCSARGKVFDLMAGEQ